MRPALARVLASLALGLLAISALGADRVRLYAGPERGVQPQLGRDLGRLVARGAGIDLDVVATAGTVDTLLRLRDDPGPRWAMLPADAADAYLAAARGSRDAWQMWAPIRLVAPLHKEEIHFLVRSDSPLQAVHQIRDARINVGPMRGGTALTVANLYRLLFDSSLPEARTSFLGHEEALAQLLTDKSIDVVAMVAEQPTRLLANMKPEARQYVRLLGFDAGGPAAAALLSVYERSLIAAEHYPNLLSADVPALAVRVMLAAHGYRRGDEASALARFSRAWCGGLARLKAEGHALWRTVDAAPAEPPSGWVYARAAGREAVRCAGGEPPADACGQQERLLGLCE